VPFENQGTFNGKAGSLGFGSGVPVTLASGSVLKGSVGFVGADVTAGSVLGAGAVVTLFPSATLSIASGATAVIGTLSLLEATVTGTGTLDVLTSLVWEKESTMSGTGTTVLEAGASGAILEKSLAYCDGANIAERTFVNDGTVTFSSSASRGSTMLMSKGARIDNNGVFIDNSNGDVCEPEEQTILEGAGRAVRIINTGTFERTDGRTEEILLTSVDVPFENWGKIEGKIEFPRQIGGGSDAWGCSEENPSFPKREVASENGVCTASGDVSETQTDFSIGGRGVGLNLTRSYNSQAAQDGVKSTFGYGWTSPYSEHLNFETYEEPEESPVHIVTLTQENGSTVEFTEQSGGGWKTPEGSPDILTGSTSAGYTLTLEGRDVYKFSGSSGRLESIADANGNTTTFAYNGSGELEKVTDPDGRTLKFTYYSDGLVESVEDPMKRVVKYTYESETLATVTQPGETALRWQFKYEGSHQLHEMIDGRGGKTTYKYSGAHRLDSKTDPTGRTTTYEYGSTFTKITNEATKAVTVEYLTSSGQLVEAVHGSGTPYATTEAFTYDTEGDMLSSTNGDGYATTYKYESGNRILMEDPEGHKTKWTYNAEHEVLTETTPDGETTTTHRNSDGDPETVERPAPGSTTQTTKYTYYSDGEEKTMENPLGKVWEYEYNGAGDRTLEKDPEGDKRTWTYNEDSQEKTMVSPLGHVTGTKEANFTTTTIYSTRGLPETVETPLKHITTYTYNGDDKIETETDPEGDKTTYTYDADNERIKIKEPNGSITETGYDGAGQITSQTDGNKHTTRYERNVLEQITEIIDPQGRKTLKEYDGAGNLIGLKDAEERTTTYKYNPDNRPVKITYSDGKTPSVEYEYNGDGDRTQMVDGTGTTTYEYDQLDRLKKTTDGHGDTVDYTYNLDNEPTKITYPNEKTITREYDNDARLEKVTDWNSQATTFKYNADSDLEKTIYPTMTGDEDTYAYNDDDQMSETKMTKGTETLASLIYTRNKDEQVTKATTTGLPGEEKPAFSYDENSRLTKGAGVTYKYDEANNPTTIGSDTYTYNVADELERAVDKKTIDDTYSFNGVGERTKTEPASGAATTYGWNQAGDLTSVMRAKSGETPVIEDTYTYNGDGLRISQTLSETTRYFAWDTAEELPLVLSDGSDSYIYGPSDEPIEQITAAGTSTYLHHDQQGSIRLLTNEKGETVGAETFNAYGGLIEHTGTASSSLGYDGQYTDTGTGLIYLRARYYDPATGQFLSVDPSAEASAAPYEYATDDPLSLGDPTGRQAERQPTEAEFARQFGHELAKVNTWAAKHHLDIETFDDYAFAGFYSALFNYNEDPSRQGADLRTYEYYAVQIAGKVTRDLAPLSPGLGSADDFEDVLKTLLKVAGRIFGI
jgi:RHS repeat-associated protein